MKRTFVTLLSISLLFIVVSCIDHIKRGDEYFEQATAAINNDSIIQAFTLIEKALGEYREGGDSAKVNKTRIFLSLLYFSTGQKEASYEIIRDMDTVTFEKDNYPLYSNYFRIKAFYLSIYEKKTAESIALIDSVINYDKKYAGDNELILNIDRLNKCEILLNRSDTSKVKSLVDSVSRRTTFPSPLEPQIYANLARLYELNQIPDSAYYYAKKVLEKTSKIHEDIDNNIYALGIMLRYDSVHNNLPDYILNRNKLEQLLDERQGERIRYGMAFVKERNRTETLSLKAHNEKRTLIWIAVCILLISVLILLILRHKHREALMQNAMIQMECDRLDAEAFRRKIENELLRNKISTKSDELKKANDEIKELSQQLVRQDAASISVGTAYLQRLMGAVDNAYPGFQERITEEHPDLTKTETTLACLIKLNLSSEEITRAMSISKSGLIKGRYRLRKRLGIESSGELDEYITRHL